MKSEKELLDFCQYVVSAGQKKGANAIEVQADSRADLDAGVELGQVNSVNRSVGTEFAVRLYLGKKMGSAFTNIPTRQALDEGIGMALSAAKATTEDKDWQRLPEPRTYKQIPGLWDESTTKCEPAKVVELAADIVGRASAAEPGVIAAQVSAGVSIHSGAYANSSGVAIAEKHTAAYIVLAGVAPTESGMTPIVVSYDVQRGLQLDLDKVVDDLASTIRLCKKTVKATSGKSTVILHPQAYSGLMQFTLLMSVRGDNVARGKSKIADKIGDTIGSQVLTIADDGTTPKGMHTSIADDEGVPRQRTPIIEKGVLRSFLWDTYWANKMGVKSTGNARRDMRQGLVDIATSNLVVSPSKRDIADIISGIKQGYLIRSLQGAHSSNPESGDFSVVGNPAFLIEGGELKGAVDGLMLAGNVYELLRNTVEVAKVPIYLESTIGPEVVFKDIQVVAKD
jgi:PmbA protein